MDVFKRKMFSKGGTASIYDVPVEDAIVVEDVGFLNPLLSTRNFTQTIEEKDGQQFLVRREPDGTIYQRLSIGLGAGQKEFDIDLAQYAPNTLDTGEAVENYLAEGRMGKAQQVGLGALTVGGLLLTRGLPLGLGAQATTGAGLAFRGRQLLDFISPVRGKQKTFVRDAKTKKMKPVTGGSEQQVIKNINDQKLKLDRQLRRKEITKEAYDEGLKKLQNKYAFENPGLIQAFRRGEIKSLRDLRLNPQAAIGIPLAANVVPPIVDFTAELAGFEDTGPKSLFPEKGGTAELDKLANELLDSGNLAQKTLARDYLRRREGLDDEEIKPDEKTKQQLVQSPYDVYENLEDARSAAMRELGPNKEFVYQGITHNTTDPTKKRKITKASFLTSKEMFRFFENLAQGLAQTGSIGQGMLYAAVTRPKAGFMSTEDAKRNTDIVENFITARDDFTRGEDNLARLNYAINELESKDFEGFGVGGLIQQTIQQGVRAFTGSSTSKYQDLNDREKVNIILEQLKQKGIREILGESGRTISNLDREIVARVFGTVNVFDSKAALLAKLKTVRDDYKRTLESSRGRIIAALDYFQSSNQRSTVLADSIGFINKVANVNLDTFNPMYDPDDGGYRFADSSIRDVPFRRDDVDDVEVEEVEEDE
mgnify:CR=1 FL=1